MRGWQKSRSAWGDSVCPGASTTQALISSSPPAISPLTASTAFQDPHMLQARPSLIAGARNADLVILNTCHIREKAAEKVYSELGRLKGLKAANPDLKIGVTGCVAQAEGEEIRNNFV